MNLNEIHSANKVFCGLVDNLHGGFGLVDNLYMTYVGNMLTSVRDVASRLPYAGATDFDGMPGENPLTYNASGSLVSDAGRGIARIDYDRQNNPVRIQFTNGSVTRYVYSAAGEKLRVSHQTAVPNITVAIGSARELAPSEILGADSTDYLLGGSLTLRNGRIDKLQFEEGYCQATEYYGNANQDNIDFQYYNRDHLGNVRQVIKATGSSKGTVIQTMGYYPFDAQFCHSSTASDVQPYKYNGKELDKMHGLNTYDYCARQYNPVTARWDRVDPLSEKNYDVSPYVYCHNNPVIRIDPNGEYDFVGINNNQYYPVIAVFPQNEIGIKGAIQTDYNAALNSGMPIMLVENINDYADAMAHLQGMSSGTGSYTINSHGLLGDETIPTSFKIGDDRVDADTDFSVLKNGLESHTVFIGACSVGNIQGRGLEMISNMSEQTNSTVIAPDHPIKAGYAYDGSNNLNNANFHPPMLPMNNEFVISHKGDLQTINNVTIDKDRGFSWDFKINYSIPGVHF